MDLNPRQNPAQSCRIPGHNHAETTTEAVAVPSDTPNPTVPSFVLLSGRSRFDSWRGHGAQLSVLVRVSGSWVLRTVPTTCARLPPFPCLNMAFYPRLWSPTLLIESRCADQLLSCSACWCGGLAFGCAAPRCWSKPCAALQFPLMHNQQRPNASGSCR